MNDDCECIVFGAIFWMVLACFVLFVFPGFWVGLNKPVEATQDPPAHVCEVTQADLKALMAEIYKLLAQRDNQIEGLQRQLYDKQNGRGKR